MVKLAEKIKAYLPAIGERFLPENNTSSFEFLTRKKTISREMHYCHETGNLVGVYSDALGKGMFLLGVQDIIAGDNGTELYIFHNLDMTGTPLSRRTLSIHEIVSIVPFNNPYVAPKLREIPECILVD